MADDRGLLERLNALKPSSVTLDTSTNALNVSATGIQPAEPLSREDALSKRLQTLRNRRDGATPSPDPLRPQPPPPPPYTEAAEGAPSRETAPTAKTAQTAPAPSATPPRQQEPSTAAAGPGDTYDLRPDDEEDRALDDILAGLDVEDDQWSLSDDDADDTTRVEELLARLKDDGGAKPPDSPAREEAASRSDDDDDSEGEEMSRKVGDVISQALDGLRLDAITNPTDADSSPDGGRIASGGGSAIDTDDRSPRDGRGDDIALPSVPRDVHDRRRASASLPRTPDDEASEEEAGLSLPTVPTRLVDPAPASTSTSTGDPFETSIAARLAALKGAPPVQTDAFGLPSAPTFQPEDRPSPGAGVTRRKSGAGYTDEDQATWCVVCLEDGTVRCLGCDGDVYCARCWREMHVGPAAGYDERGHQWEKFDRRRV